MALPNICLSLSSNIPTLWCLMEDAGQTLRTTEISLSFLVLHAKVRRRMPALSQAFFWPFEKKLKAKKTQNSRKKLKLKLKTSRWNNAQYALSHQKCLLLNVWALSVSPSPYLVGLLWYALSCFRMCLYQAFLAMPKKIRQKTQSTRKKLKLKLKTQIFGIFY